LRLATNNNQFRERNGPQFNVLEPVLFLFELNFYKSDCHDTISDLARDLALVAYGLLGEVDKVWTQHILEGCVKMSFLHRRHKDQFRERWASLNEAEWYTTCADCSADGEKDERGPILSVMNSPTYIAYIPWEAKFAEGDQIRKALTAWGFQGAGYFELTNMSMQSKVIKLNQLAAKCGVEGFNCVELEADNENERTPVLLVSSNLKQLAAFKMAIEATGGL
jgi:hypothetical protein